MWDFQPCHLFLPQERKSTTVMGSSSVKGSTPQWPFLQHWATNSGPHTCWESALRQTPAPTLNSSLTPNSPIKNNSLLIFLTGQLFFSLLPLACFIYIAIHSSFALLLLPEGCAKLGNTVFRHLWPWKYFLYRLELSIDNSCTFRNEDINARDRFVEHEGGDILIELLSPV